MPHIHTEPGQHDHTVSAYIIRTDFDEPKIMLHKHRLLQTWLQFGGHIELNETPWQAISHEIREETGYDMGQLKILQPPDRIKSLPNNVLHPLPISYVTHGFPGLEHAHTDIAFAFVADGPPKHQRAKGESAEIQLFTSKELQAFKDAFEDNRLTCLFALETCLPKWEQVDTHRFS